MDYAIINFMIDFDKGIYKNQYSNRIEWNKKILLLSIGYSITLAILFFLGELINACNVGMGALISLLLLPIYLIILGIHVLALIFLFNKLRKNFVIVILLIISVLLICYSIFKF